MEGLSTSPPCTNHWPVASDQLATFIGSLRLNWRGQEEAAEAQAESTQEEMGRAFKGLTWSLWSLRGPGRPCHCSLTGDLQEESIALELQKDLSLKCHHLQRPADEDQRENLRPSLDIPPTGCGGTAFSSQTLISVFRYLATRTLLVSATRNRQPRHDFKRRRKTGSDERSKTRCAFTGHDELPGTPQHSSQAGENTTAQAARIDTQQPKVDSIGTLPKSSSICLPSQTPGESANAVPHYHKLCSRVSHIWGNRRGQHIRSAMDKPRPGKTTFVIMVSPLPGKYELLCSPRPTPSRSPTSSRTLTSLTPSSRPPPLHAPRSGLAHPGNNLASPRLPTRRTRKPSRSGTSSLRAPRYLHMPRPSPEVPRLSAFPKPAEDSGENAGGICSEPST
ncbi:uncharacterized protein [Pseudorca crassidens]|uniref:uncharacterized protein n=1 Tax=Pseudorca crassidens TaxID=82174 RepID=UPI00352D9C5C